MKHRVLLYTFVDPKHPGGVETVFRGIVNACRNFGFSVDELRRAQCRLRVHRNKRRYLHMPSIARLSMYLLRVRPSVVNVHFIWADTIYFALLKHVFGYRLILSFHGSDLLLPTDHSSALMPSILKRADKITVVSSHMRDALAAMPGVDMSNVHVVNNGIDPDFWCPPAVPRTSGRTILCAGRLEKVKGIDIMISAFVQIATAVPDAQLVIAGRGSQREALERQVAEKGLTDRVRFLGLLDRDALRAAYHDADLFVMPSRSEGFPVALLEAMATGLPFVASDVGGAGEIATEKTGRLVPPQDVLALTREVVKAFTERDLSKAGIAARKRAEIFSMEAAEQRYIEIIAGAGLDSRTIGQQAID